MCTDECAFRLLAEVLGDDLTNRRKRIRFDEINQAYRARLPEVLTDEQYDIYLSIRLMAHEQGEEENTLDELAEDF